MCGGYSLLGYRGYRGYYDKRDAIAVFGNGGINGIHGGNFGKVGQCHPLLAFQFIHLQLIILKAFGYFPILFYSINTD